MGYSSLRACIDDLEENKLLIRIKEEMDPNLEMASRHLQEFKNSGKALLFENIKGSKYSSVSNLFGTLERSNFIFRNSIQKTYATNYMPAPRNPTAKRLRHKQLALGLRIQIARCLGTAMNGSV